MTRRKDTNNRVLKEGEYQRSNGTYEYKWTTRLGARKSIYAKTLEELRRKEEAIIKDIIDDIATDCNDITINQLYDKWKKTKKNLKDSTVYVREYTYNKHIREKYGDLPAKNFKKSDFITIYQKFEEDGMNKSTINRIHDIFKQMFDFLVDDDIIRKNPVQGAYKTFYGGRTSVDKVKALTAKQQKTLELYLSRDGRFYDVYPMIMILLWTGMRVGEAGALRWCDVNLEEEYIDIKHTLLSMPNEDNNCGFIIHDTPKTSSSIRRIPMLPKVKEMFLLQKNLKRQSNIEINGYTDFIFLTRRNYPICASLLNKKLNQIVSGCNAIGGNLPHITCHMLRHSFATRMCEANMNMKAVQSILGHSNIDITYNIYTDATEDLIMQELNLLTTELTTI